MAKPRAVVGARVSVFGPEKISHEAQLETCTRWAEYNGFEIVGSFEDLGVSAQAAPHDRPGLGAWLTDEKATEWDAIVWSKVDRAFRSANHCVDFVRWAEERGKVVVFADDGLKLDYRNTARDKSIDAMMSEFFVQVAAFFASIELNRFKTRATDAHREFRQMDRWVTGVPPLGFKVIPHPSGKGKGLATDPEGKKLLHEMANRLLAGLSFVRISEWLSGTDAVTNQDRARIAKGKERSRRGWSVRTVRDVLTSERTQGLKTHKGVTVLNADGEPIRLAPPTFDDDMWKQIQEAAALRRISPRSRTHSQNPMLGVGVCGCTGCTSCEGKTADGICGASIAQQVARRTNSAGEHVRTHRYYRCSRTPAGCKGGNMRADTADNLLDIVFLLKQGDKPVTRRRFVSGEDNAHELDKTNRIIAGLREDRALGLYSTSEDELIFRQQIAAQLAKRDALAAVPARKADWVTEETGETYREVWDTGDHRQLLIDAEIRVEVSPDRIGGGVKLMFLHKGEPFCQPVYIRPGGIAESLLTS